MQVLPESLALWKKNSYTKCMANKAFPDILAVDPPTCGCLECIVGEYVNERTWCESATPADVVAVLNGDVRNNTYGSLANLVLDNSFANDDTNDFIRKLREHALEIVATYGDLDALADEYS